MGTVGLWQPCGARAWKARGPSAWAAGVGSRRGLQVLSAPQLTGGMLTQAAPGAAFLGPWPAARCLLAPVWGGRRGLWVFPRHLPVLAGGVKA